MPEGLNIQVAQKLSASEGGPKRFKLRKVRLGLFLVSSGLMLYALGTVATYPRL
jgi:hypothetical protein